MSPPSLLRPTDPRGLDRPCLTITLPVHCDSSLTGPRAIPPADGRFSMAAYALVSGWGEVVTGREQQATQVFGETMAYFGRLQQEGQIAGVEPYFLEPHGGDLGGFFLLRGEGEALAQVRGSQEFGRIIQRASMVV